jgi:hypothetical protein
MKFIKPCEGKITSYYGKDILNGQERIHFGIDLAQLGKVEIKAVADGVVSRSYLSTSYGECIRIIHSIEGEQWESLYAHMKTGSRKFNDGDSVKQGEVIGIMGNTGYSFGQHLHFEVHQPSWETDKRYSVDPMLYLKEEEEVKGMGEYKFEPSNKTLQDSVKRVLTRLSNKPQDSISKDWRKKFECGEMTESDALALLYHAFDKELIQGSMKKKR